MRGGREREGEVRSVVVLCLFVKGRNWMMNVNKTGVVCV